MISDKWREGLSVYVAFVNTGIINGQVFNVLNEELISIKILKCAARTISLFKVGLKWKPLPL